MSSILPWEDLFAWMWCSTPWPDNFQPVQNQGRCKHTLLEICNSVLFFSILYCDKAMLPFSEIRFLLDSVTWGTILCPSGETINAYFAFFDQGLLHAALLLQVTCAVRRESFITRVFGAGRSCGTSVSVCTGTSVCVTGDGRAPSCGNNVQISPGGDPWQLPYAVHLV